MEHLNGILAQGGGNLNNFFQKMSIAWRDDLGLPMGNIEVLI